MTTLLADENIIKLLGIESLPEERKRFLVGRFADLVQQRVLLRILEVLPEAEQESFKKILMEGKTDEIQSFLGKNQIDMVKFLQEEVGNVKKDLSNITKEA